MRIEKLIAPNNLSKVNLSILQTCFKGNYRDNLGEFSNIKDWVWRDWDSKGWQEPSKGNFPYTLLYLHIQISGGEIVLSRYVFIQWQAFYL